PVTPFLPAGSIDKPVDLATSPDGALYYLAHGGSLGGITASSQLWYLRNSNSPGSPNLAHRAGPTGGQSLACDWDGSGGATPATFLNGFWYLWNDHSGGTPAAVLAYGTAGDKPVCGDWNGDGIDSIGVFENGHFYLRNSN